MTGEQHMTEEQEARVKVLMAKKNRLVNPRVRAVDGRLVEARAAKALALLTAFDKVQSETEAYKD